MIDLKEINSPLNDNGLNFFNVFILVSGLENSVNPLSSDKPKSLIPIVNKPILAYQLEFFERFKFKEITLISHKKYYSEIDTYINEKFIGNLKIDIVSVNNEKNLSSLELFQIIKNKINRKNFIVLNGDSILDFNLSAFLDNHLLNESLISMVLMKDDQKFLNNKLKYLYNTLEITLFGLEENKQNFTNYRKAVFQKSVFDDCLEGDVKFKKDLLLSNKNFDLIYNYDDINFYIFNKNIYKLLDNEHIKKKNLIKNDLIPFLINKSYKKILTKLIYGTKKKQNLDNSDENQEQSRVEENFKESKLRKNPIEIMAFLLDSEQNYAYRISDLNKVINIMPEIQKNYEEIQKVYFYTKNNTKNVFLNFMNQIQKNIDNDRPYFEGCDYIESISKDSYVADPIKTIAKKSRINKCIIGGNILVGDNSKINFSYLFDNVSIGKDCKLTNCIIGNNVIIEDGCSLTDCVIPDNITISAKKEFSNQTIDD